MGVPAGSLEHGKGIFQPNRLNNRTTPTGPTSIAVVNRKNVSIGGFVAGAMASGSANMSRAIV